jgi:hypothetical protein
MLLILEISLAIAAWKNGWGARALLPLVGALVLGFIAGTAIGASAGSVESARAVGLLLDLGAITALGIMARKAPASDTPEIPASEQEARVPLSDYSPLSGD